MAIETLEAKAHELISQLIPGKLAAVVHLLEVIMDDNNEPVSDEDRRRFHEGQAWFAQRDGKGIGMEDLLSGLVCRVRISVSRSNASAIPY